MNLFPEIRHHLRYLLRRHAWELAAAFLSAILIPVVFHAGISLHAERTLTHFSLFLHGLAIVRISLSEGLLRSFGECATRPVRLSGLVAGQILVLLGLWTLSSLAIQIGLQIPIRPSALLGNSLSYIFYLLTPLLLFSHTFARRLSSDQRQATFSILILLLLPVFLWIGAGFFNAPSTGSGGTTRIPAGLQASIRSQLEPAQEFIGNWNTDFSNTPWTRAWEESSEKTLPPSASPTARPFLRLPLHHAAPPVSLAKGSYLRDLRIEPSADAVTVTFTLTELEPHFIPRLSGDPVAVVLYANRMVGAPLEAYKLPNPSSRLLGHQANDLTLRLKFNSPLGLPEWKDRPFDAWRPVEIVFFTPYLQHSLEDLSSFQQKLPASQLPTLPSAYPPVAEYEKLRSTLQQALVLLNLQDPQPSLARIPDRLPPPEGALVLLQLNLPWSDLAWKELIEPTLTAHARTGLLPALTRKLATEPRLTRLFIDRGWQDHALPVLRRRALERLPLPPEALRLLLPSADDELLEALADIAARDRIADPDLMEAFRSHPSFPWSSFTLRAWQVRRDSASEFRPDITPARTSSAAWAAGQGDRTALFALVQDASSAETPSLVDPLTTLVPASKNAPHPLAFIRENYSRLRFEPAGGAWIVSP